MYKFLTAGALVIFILGISCSEESQVSPNSKVFYNFDTISFQHHSKGYELYSWQDGETWVFAVLPGTNRLKSYTEVIDSPYKVRGVAQLKTAVKAFPQNEEIIWMEEEWLSQIWIEDYNNLQLPTSDIVEQVKFYAEQSKLIIRISNQ